MTDDEYDAYLDELVAQAPPFSEATRAKLYELFRPVREERYAEFLRSRGGKSRIGDAAGTHRTDWELAQ